MNLREQRVERRDIADDPSALRHGVDDDAAARDREGRRKAVGHDIVDEVVRLDLADADLLERGDEAADGPVGGAAGGVRLPAHAARTGQQAWPIGSIGPRGRHGRSGIVAQASAALHVGDELRLDFKQRLQHVAWFPAAIRARDMGAGLARARCAAA